MVPSVPEIPEAPAASAGEFNALVDAARQSVEDLVRVRDAVHAVDQAQLELAAAVAAARASGSSWRQVGLAAGMTGRGAQKRWGGP